MRLMMYTTESFLKESGRKINDKTICEIQKAIHESDVAETVRMQELLSARRATKNIKSHQDRMRRVAKNILDPQDRMQELIGVNSAIQSAIDQENRIQQMLGTNMMVQSAIDQENRIQQMLGSSGITSSDKISTMMAAGNLKILLPYYLQYIMV